MAALPLGPAMNFEGMPVGGCAQPSVHTPQALLLGRGVGRVLCSPGTGRKAAQVAQEVSADVLASRSPTPSSPGPCHRDSGLALTSLDRSCHIWLPGSPLVKWQDSTPQPWGSGTTHWHMPSLAPSPDLGGLRGPRALASLRPVLQRPKPMQTCWSSSGSSATSSPSPSTYFWVGRDLGFWKLGAGPGHGHGQEISFRSPTPSSSEESVRSPSHRGVPARSRGEGRGARAGQRGGGQAAAPTRRHPSVTHSPRGEQAAGTRGRGAGKGSRPPGRARALWPRRWVGAPAAPSPARVRPAPPRPSRRSRLPGPRGESSCNFAGEAAAGLGLGAGLRPAVRRQAAGAPTPRPARRPPARFVRGGEGRPQAWPPPRAQKGARPAGGGAGPARRTGRAGPGRAEPGPGRRPGQATLTCRGTSPCRRRTRS